MDYLNKNKENLDEETYELYDRNIRLWGKENQIKLNRSYVLLINLNGVVTELAKNFVLSGVNLYLYDRIENSLPHLVELDDIKSNFFLDSRDLKKERGKVLKEKLSQINSYVSVEELESLENLEGVNIQSACLGFISFHTTNYYEDLFTKIRIPLYVVNISGTYGFFYSNVLVRNSCENVSEGTSRECQTNNFSFSESLMIYFDQFNKSNSKRSKVKFYLAISVCILELLEKRITQREIQEIGQDVNLLEKYIGSDHSALISKDENFSKVLKNLISNFNNQYNPVSAVIAGVVSQEIFHVLTDPTQVHSGLYTYDAETQIGNFIK